MVGRIPHPDYTTCEVTMEFAHPVDLDGDGIADFSHERFLSKHHLDYQEGPAEEWSIFHQDDTVETLFPAAHVELYWLVWSPYSVGVEPRLLAGHELLPEPLVSVHPPYGSWGLPEPARSWVYPRLAAEGLGILVRNIEKYPCEWKGTTIICTDGYFAGWMSIWSFPPGWDGRTLESDQYFGFRVQRADGWHLGWLRLYWKQTPGPTLAPLTLVSSAVHPEPDTPIVAGEPARPRLRAGREGAEVVLRWSPVWTNAVLERTASLSAPAWEAVSGATNHTARLPAAGPPAFFRLRTP
jgi:hypothetical protein